MRTLIPTLPSHTPDRRCRRARPVVEGLEVRQVPTALPSPTSLVQLNPQPLPPGSGPISIYYPPNPCVFHPPGPVAPHIAPGPI
jgi:hypothetical protein